MTLSCFSGVFDFEPGFQEDNNRPFYESDDDEQADTDGTSTKIHTYLCTILNIRVRALLFIYTCKCDIYYVHREQC